MSISLESLSSSRREGTILLTPGLFRPDLDLSVSLRPWIVRSLGSEDGETGFDQGEGMGLMSKRPKTERRTSQ